MRGLAGWQLSLAVTRWYRRGEEVKGNECTNLSYRWEFVCCNRFPAVLDTTRDLPDGLSGNDNKLGKGCGVDLVVKLGFHPFRSTRATWNGCV
jgi:hypothetical protein